MTGYGEPDLRAELARVSDALVRLANGVMRDGLGEASSTPMDVGWIVDNVKACRAWGVAMKEALASTCVRTMEDESPCWCVHPHDRKKPETGPGAEHESYCEENRAEWAARGGGWRAVDGEKHDAATNNLFNTIRKLEQERDGALKERDYEHEKRAEACSAGIQAADAGSDAMIRCRKLEQQVKDLQDEGWRKEYEEQIARDSGEIIALVHTVFEACDAPVVFDNARNIENVKAVIRDKMNTLAGELRVARSMCSASEKAVQDMERDRDRVQGELRIAKELVASLDKDIKGLREYRTALQERVAFAEAARDNAVEQREAVTERAKAKAKSAGDRINKLIALVRSHVGGVYVEAALKEILGDDQAQRVSAIEEMAASMSEAEVKALPIRDRLGDE